MFGLTDPTTDLGSPSPSFTRKELAAMFGISDVTVKRLTNDQNALHPDRLNQRVLRYTAADLQRMVALGYQLNLAEAVRLGVDTTALTPPSATRKAAVLPAPNPSEDGSALNALLAELMLTALRDPRVRAEFRDLIGETRHLSQE